MFKANNEGRQGRRSGVFIANFERIPHISVVFLMLSLGRYIFPRLLHFLRYCIMIFCIMNC